MDIQSLKTLLQVQTHGSIAGAARALDQDPSSVSRTVAAIEAKLGLRLFQRTTRRLTVTDEGQAYLSRIAPLVEEMDAALEDARQLQGRPAGHLRMTASVAFADQVILPLLPEFQTMYPDITIGLQSNDQNVDLVADAIDLAIRLTPAPQGDLVSTRLMPTRYRLVASPDYVKAHPVPHPEALREVNCLRFALPGLDSTWQFQQPGGTSFEVLVDGNLSLSNALAMRRAARQGMGVAMLADWMLAEDLQQGRLVTLCPEFACCMNNFDTAVWALYPNRAYLPQKVRVMIDFLRSHMR